MNVASVYKHRDKSSVSIWDAGSDKAVYRANKSLETFHIFSRVNCLNNHSLRQTRHEKDKLADAMNVWDRDMTVQHWTSNDSFHSSILTVLYVPGGQRDATSSDTWNIQVSAARSDLDL